MQREDHGLSAVVLALARGEAIVRFGLHSDADFDAPAVVRGVVARARVDVLVVLVIGRSTTVITTLPRVACQMSNGTGKLTAVLNAEGDVYMGLNLHLLMRALDTFIEPFCEENITDSTFEAPAAFPLLRLVL